MKQWNSRIVAVSALLLVLAMAIAAGAQQRKQMRGANWSNIAQNFAVRDFVSGLRLTDDQRQAIRSILQSHRTDIRDTREAILRARLELVKEDPNGPADFGAAQARLMDLRLRIGSEIKGKLTADQLAVLQERQQKREGRLQKMLERFTN